MRWTLLLCLLAPLTAPGLTVEVTREDDGHWTARYHAEQPFDRLAFTRGISAIRHPDWRAEGARWEREGSREILVLEAPRRELTLRFPGTVQTLVRDYELVRPFTDGGAALYTGHLAARPALGGAAPRDEVMAYRFVPRRGEAVVVAGVQHLVPVTWTDVDGGGRYVYFGALEPVAGEAVLAVLDPGLPGWAVARLDALIPVLFDYFERHYGPRDGARPTVLFAFQPGGGGLESGGGALPGQLQLFLKGDGWLEHDPATAGQLDDLLAHESAHLWNHTAIHNREAEQAAWLHEGGADAMAREALVALGRLDAAPAATRLDRRLNTCLAGLGQRGLAALSASEFQLHYACGEVIFRLVAAATGDLPGFMRAVFARATDGGYDRQAFLDALDAAAPALGAVLEPLLMAPAVDANATLAAAAPRSGLVLAAEAGVPDRRYAVQLAVDGLAHLMGQACDGRFSLDVLDGAVRLNAVDGCEAFAADRVVRSVGGVSIWADGAGVYDSLVAACAGEGPVLLADGEGEAVEVACRLALPPRAPYYSLRPAD